MPQEIGQMTELALLRQLRSDALSRTPSSVEEGLEQKAVVRYLERKIDEKGQRIMTGD